MVVYFQIGIHNVIIFFLYNVVQIIRLLPFLIYFSVVQEIDM